MNTPGSKKEGLKTVHSNNDWMFGSADWFTNYGHAEADFMLPGCSVLLNTGLPIRPLKRHFRFLTVLLKQDDFHTAAQEV